MYKRNEKIIFHIDVNSAYLSWMAVSFLQQGKSLDIRTIPAVIGGDVNKRHGIVLAKSIVCKKFKIETGETLYSARGKCKNLKVYPPDYNLFMKCSNAMADILNEYTPMIQRYSVDECFLDVTHFGEDYLRKAKEIKNRIEVELGFTVNIGISSNKLLAKMASDFKKPNKIHTLFPEEIEKKMWPLPVEDLFMVGRATKPKLNKLNIYTIYDLANYDREILISIFKSFGKTLYNYANGIDSSEVRKTNYINIKGVGNSTTISYDIDNRKEAERVLLSITENTAMRLRKNKSLCSVVCVSIKSDSFATYSHQKKLSNATDCTSEIYKGVKELFNEMWKGERIRHLGIRLSSLCSNKYYQTSLFDNEKVEKQRAIDSTLDNLREKYGASIIIRSTFLNSGVKPMTGGVGEEEYPMMSSML